MAGLTSSFGLIIAMVAAAIVAFGGGAAVRADAPPFKVDICHATDADNNPYTRNNVSFNSIADAEDVNGHGDHTGPIWAPGDQDAKITWGDIIPEYFYPTGVAETATFHYPGMNWTPQGQAIWDNSCKIPAPPPEVKKPVNVTTTVFDSLTDKALTGQETAGTSVYDTAKVVPPSVFPVPTGTVTYVYYTSGNCVAANALGADHLTVTLSAGKAPNSMTEGPLPAGSYSFKANYSGDANYLAGTSACEPFTIAETPPGPKKTVVVTTTVFDSSTDKALTGGETAGTSVYDTARVVPPSVFPVPTGTVTYVYYTSGNCVAANALGADHLTVTLSAGKAPNSMTEGPLPTGSYSFKANYSGDANYLAGTSACEPLTVLKADPGISTNQNPVSGLVGATIKDSASITGGFNLTGTVTFVLKLNGSTVLTSDPIALDAQGNAAFTTGYLANTAGTYYWIATYNGDGNNNTVTSGATDEPVIISTQMVPAIVTTPDPTSTTVGATLKDTATIGGIANPNGYILFTLKDPNGNVAWTKKMNVTANGSYKTPDGFVANVQGTWHWIAGYYDAENTLIVQSGANDEPVTVGPTGGVLAQTAAALPGQGLAGGLLVIGLLAIFGAIAWRRRSA